MAMLGSERLAVHFPESAEVPESKRHFQLRTLVYEFLSFAFAEVAAIGCDQFVYWDATNPRVCLAPDAFVHFGQKDDQFGSWKVWERGVPQVAVEIISNSDANELSWDEKLERYRQLGVSELVWFDPESPAQPLRIWDRVAGELLERRLSEPCAQSRLGGYWLPIADPERGLTLRLSRDPHGRQLLPTLAEHNAQQFRAEAEARCAAEQALRHETEALRHEAEALRRETEIRLAAERRIVELEAELKRRS